MPAAVPLLGAIGGRFVADKMGIGKNEGMVAGLGMGSALYGAMSDRQTQQMSAQERAQALQFINQQTGQAQDYLSGSFAPMQQALNQGYGGALEALRGSAPLRLDAITRGAQDAQRFQIGALPLIQQALMGVPMDLSQIAPHVQTAKMPFDSMVGYDFLSRVGPK
jgi:hypothetical protein